MGSMTEANFLRLRIQSDGLANAANQVLQSASGDSPARAFHLVNSFTIGLFATKVEENPLVSDVAVNFPDGFWLSRYLKGKAPAKVFPQIRGPQLFYDVLSSPGASEITQLFLGSTEETLSKLSERLLTDSKFSIGREKIFTISPPFVALSDDYMDWLAKTILEKDIRLIWVGMGTPKQDYLAELLTARTEVTTVAVGAAFDFLAGTKTEAPKMMTRLGIEWLYRLATEPRRLWKRYLIGNLVFIGLVIRDMSRK
jgi:N-acetylglucosaminyldiphosphoundecaprenol N-acetyl-beta-D-mannosaminyltransferase